MNTDIMTVNRNASSGMKREREREGEKEGGEIERIEKEKKGEKGER